MKRSGTERGGDGNSSGWEGTEWDGNSMNPDGTERNEMGWDETVRVGTERSGMKRGGMEQFGSGWNGLGRVGMAQRGMETVEVMVERGWLGMASGAGGEGWEAVAAAGMEWLGTA